MFCYFGCFELHCKSGLVPCGPERRLQGEWEGMVGRDSRTELYRVFLVYLCVERVVVDLHPLMVESAGKTKEREMESTCRVILPPHER